MKDLGKLDLCDMEIGDIYDIYFGKFPQVSITCTQNCGFKYYIVLGNGIGQETFCEGNSKEEYLECISLLYDYVLALEDEYNHIITDWEKVNIK